VIGRLTIAVMLLASGVTLTRAVTGNGYRVSASKKLTSPLGGDVTSYLSIGIAYKFVVQRAIDLAQTSTGFDKGLRRAALATAAFPMLQADVPGVLASSH